MSNPISSKITGKVDPKTGSLAATLSVSGESVDIIRSIAGTAPTQRVEVVGIPRVALMGETTTNSERAALWTAIRSGSQAIGYKAYNEFINRVLADATAQIPPDEQSVRRPYSHLGTDAYNLLRDATRAFVAINCGSLWDAVADLGGKVPGTVNLPFARPRDAATGQPVPATNAIPGEESRRGLGLTYRELVTQLQTVLPTGTTPYLEQISKALLATTGTQQLQNSFGKGVVRQRLLRPCLIELIWSYYIEESAVVQAINAIALRFQNRRGPGERDPLAHLKFDSLRPLANLLWGYIQDENNRLTLPRRVYEYAHEYGLTLLGRAVPVMQPADSRSKFLEAFNNLLHASTRFFKEADDKTVVPDGFPLLNALKEVHLHLARGAHNQFGDLPATARVEMLIQQWLLARPEIREYLGGPPAVPYPEDWMGPVDTMKSLQGWSDVSVMHFRDLAILGEQLLLAIRHEDWSDTAVRTAADAASWAIYWRSEVQSYIHAYRVITGVDLSNDVTDARAAADRYTQPAVLHRRRMELDRAQRNGAYAYSGRRLAGV